MAHDQEQTLCWQISWPPGELAPPAAKKSKTRVLKLLNAYLFNTVCFFTNQVSIFPHADSPFQCMQPPGLPLGSAVPPVGWHKLQPSSTKLPEWQDGHRPPPEEDDTEFWKYQYQIHHCNLLRIKAKKT